MLDDAARIQSAIDRCPDGEVVQLSKGTFLINDGHFLLIHKGITLRGAGPGETVLAKTDGAKPMQETVGVKPAPVIIIGPARFAATGHASDIAASTPLTADAVKGSFEIAVREPARFSPGQIVLLDEASGAGWQKDPQKRGKVWASPDFRVVWQKHDPPVAYADDFTAETYPTTPGAAGSWFSRTDRPTAEIKEVAKVSATTVTFTTPVHISYRTGNAAQLSRYARQHVTYAGVEDLKLTGGDDGNLRFQWAARSWARNVDVTNWHGEGVAIDSAFRVELREFYVHDAAWAQPGGAGYAISLSRGTSETLIENGIALRANKLLVFRSAGAGSVVGYNYIDMAYINTNSAWIEIGLNASHMVGSHHVLFEGNEAHNADSDSTHGNSIDLTFFRNHMSCVRAPFTNQAGGLIDDASESGSAPKRCAGAMAYSYGLSFVGNVLGAEGRMKGWAYETHFTDATPGIWLLGWDPVAPYPTDAQVASDTLRHANFDFLRDTVQWDERIASRDLPASLYLAGKPEFFDAGRGYGWPWVDPIGPVKTRILPAKARHDNGTPFVQP
ncbi:MAG: hypothetical protein JNM89_06705 [Hyphomicrobiaceae bacterium]|nr:hypothetical protein [Hyphomicrobiaceae bacterium]